MLISGALISSNVELLIEKNPNAYQLSSAIDYIKSFDPSYEIIDYIMSRGFSRVIEKMYLSLIKNDDYNKIMYIINNYNTISINSSSINSSINNSSINMVLLLRTVGINYINTAHKYIVDDTGGSVSELIRAKFYLFLILSNINITLDEADLTEIRSIPVNGAEFSYITYDLVSFIAFRLINDNMLKNTSLDTIEDILDTVIYCNAPEVIENKLLEFIPESSPMYSYDYRYENYYSYRYNKPKHYHSLFEEDI